MVVYKDGEIVGEVEYTDNLDYWDGRNYTSGETGRHKGLAMLGDDYVLVHGTQWQGEKDYAEIISAEQAVEEILKSGNTELFGNEFPELQELRESLYQRKAKGRTDRIQIRISPNEKKRWTALAESRGQTLTEMIQEAVIKIS